MVEILSGTTAARSVAQSSPVPSAGTSSEGGSGAAPSIQTGFYLSPVIRFDSEALAVIFELRDSSSGEVKNQIPSERAVRELQRSASLGLEEASAPNSDSGQPEAVPQPAQQAQPAPESGSGAAPEQDVNVLI